MSRSSEETFGVRRLSEDRYLRFGSHCRSEVMHAYVAHIDFERSIVLGCFDTDAVLRGIAHLNPGPLEWELGLSVDPVCRGQGLGTRLIRRALKDARLAGAPRLMMHCLAENHALLRIVTSLGAQVVIRDGSAEGIILCASSRKEFSKDARQRASRGATAEAVKKTAP